MTRILLFGLVVSAELVGTHVSPDHSQILTNFSTPHLELLTISTGDLAFSRTNDPLSPQPTPFPIDPESHFTLELNQGNFEDEILHEEEILLYIKDGLTRCFGGAEEGPQPVTVVAITDKLLLQPTRLIVGCTCESHAPLTVSLDCPFLAEENPSVITTNVPQTAAWQPLTIQESTPSKWKGIVILDQTESHAVLDVEVINSLANTLGYAPTNLTEDVLRQRSLQTANFDLNPADLLIHMVQNQVDAIEITLRRSPIDKEEEVTTEIVETAAQAEINNEPTAEAGYDSTAEAGPEATAQAEIIYDPTAEVGYDSTAEAGYDSTAEAGAEATAEADAEATAEADAEASAEATAQAEIIYDPTAEVGYDSTAEAGAEATAQAEIIYDPTAEVGYDSTAEVGYDSTAEVGYDSTAEAGAEATAQAEIIYDSTAEAGAEATAQAEISYEATAKIEFEDRVGVA